MGERNGMSVLVEPPARPASRPSSLRRVASRISFRLMAFNVLLVFLPVAGMLYLGSYESKLLAAQNRTLTGEARLLSAASERLAGSFADGGCDPLAALPRASGQARR